MRTRGLRTIGSHGIAPLTSFVGTTYATDADGNTVQVNTPPITNLTAFGNTTMDGNALTAAIQGDWAGELAGASHRIGIVTPGNAPLTAGGVYSTDTGSTFWVYYPVTATYVASCSPGLDPNSPGAMEVDHAQYSGGVPTVLAVQFDLVCDFGATGSTEFVGTAAINITPTTPGQGYYLFDSYGGLSGFGNDSYLNYLGDLTQVNLQAPVVAMATTPSGAGDWMTAGDGEVFSFGDAQFYGSTGNLTLSKPIVGMAATHDGKGYWLVASDGGVFSFGDAAFYGSTGNLTLHQPVVGMAATSDSRGYWFAAADGGVFSYGDARFFGSTGAIQLAEPVVGMTAAPDDDGYWFTANDGGVFGFDSAPYEGAFEARATPTSSVWHVDAGGATGRCLSAPDAGVGGSPSGRRRRRDHPFGPGNPRIHLSRSGARPYRWGVR